MLTPMPTGRRGEPGSLTREIGAIIGRALREDGRTQAEFASVVGVSQSQLSKMIRGEKHIDVEQLAAMCGTLDLAVVAVLTEAEAVTAARDGLRLRETAHEPLGEGRKEDQGAA